MTGNPCKSPRVLHIVYNLIRGGTEGQCARVAMACARQGAQHQVVVFERKGFFLEPVEEVCGPLYEIPIRHVLRWTTWRHLCALSKYIRANQVDLVHAWDADAAIFGGLAARMAGVPFITSRRDLGEIYPPWKVKLMRCADHRACGVVVNADVILQRLARSGLATAKIHRISNILDSESFDRRMKEDPDFPLPGGRLIGVVNRLDPEKNTGQVVRSFAKIRRRYPDISLVIAGDGPERPVLESLAQELGVADRTVFLGDIHQVPALVSRLSVGVLVPKSNEGLSNTVLEYMAGGIPAVVSDCGGNRELVQGLSGTVVPIGDVAALSKAIMFYLDHPHEARIAGINARNRVETMCHPEKVVGAFMDLYASCLEP